MVSEAVRSSLLKKSEPHESWETLVCRSWFKVKKQEASPQRELRIQYHGGGGDMITLSKTMALPVSLIKKNFFHNYCRTCHYLNI